MIPSFQLHARQPHLLKPAPRFGLTLHLSSILSHEDTLTKQRAVDLSFIPIDPQSDKTPAPNEPTVPVVFIPDNQYQEDRDNLTILTNGSPDQAQQNFTAIMQGLILLQQRGLLTAQTAGDIANQVRNYFHSHAKPMD